MATISMFVSVILVSIVLVGIIKILKYGKYPIWVKLVYSVLFVGFIVLLFMITNDYVSQ